LSACRCRANTGASTDQNSCTAPSAVGSTGPSLLPACHRFWRNHAHRCAHTLSERVEEFLTSLLLGYYLKHVCSRDAGKTLALELDVVSPLRKAGVEGAFERLQREVLALSVLAMLRWRVLITELFREIFAQVTVHHFECAGIERGDAGGGDLGQLLCQLRTLLTIDAFPRCAVLPLIGREQIRIDRRNDAV